jgi:hypothetical protein
MCRRDVICTTGCDETFGPLLVIEDFTGSA